MKQIQRPPPLRPDDSDPDLRPKVEWLLRTYGYCPTRDMVIDMFKASADCMLKREAFIFTFYGWNEPRIGVHNKPLVKPKLATDSWTDHKLIVEDVRMRPDMPYPDYREGGHCFKNIYQQPQHEGDGDIRPFLRFMERFLPDRRQRHWIYDWLAHKQDRPEIPGTTILFVADNDEEVREGRFGTGRGMFFQAMHKLYGEAYSRAEDFDIIAGTSGQAVYTDWRHNSVLVTVDEAQTSPTAYRRGERKSVYEVMKNVVDPAPKRCRFKVKHGQAFDGMSYASFMIATNHANAVAIPRKDRRFTVLVNGREMTTEEATEFATWLQDPANITALSRFLDGRNLVNFNMYAPLDTEAKAEMAELSRTPVEDALLDLAEDKARGLVFTRLQLEHAVEELLGGGKHKSAPGQAWRGQLEGSFHDHVAGLSSRNGAPWRVRVNGVRVRLYAFRSRKRAALKLTEAQRRIQAMKWGPIELTEEERKALHAKFGVPNVSPDTSLQ